MKIKSLNDLVSYYKQLKEDFKVLDLTRSFKDEINNEDKKTRYNLLEID